MANKRTLILGAAILASLLLIFVIISAAKRVGGNSSSIMAQGSREAAGDNRPLKEKAKQFKAFIGKQEPNRAIVYADLSALAKSSAAVVIGTPKENISTLSPDGKSITLEYTVNLEYGYKGTLQAGKIIRVSLPGGKVMFEDGTTAEIRTPWFKKMQNGTTYLLFLNEAPGGGSFVTTGEAQGLFEIPTGEGSRTIKTYTGIMRDPMWKYQNMDVRAFLKEVRLAIKKESKK